MKIMSFLNTETEIADLSPFSLPAESSIVTIDKPQYSPIGDSEPVCSTYLGLLANASLSAEQYIVPAGSFESQWTWTFVFGIVCADKGRQLRTNKIGHRMAGRLSCVAQVQIELASTNAGRLGNARLSLGG